MELGIKQTLVCKKKEEFGMYLCQNDGSDEKVLLPIKQVPKDAKIGDEIEVFLYRDSKDRLIATTNEPKVTLGKIARLNVREAGKIGAFLDWGLEKDLLLPFAEQTARVKAGDSVLAALYIDKSNRLCATMNVYKYLSQDSDYKKDDKVTGTVYQISDNFGAFVAVDDMYSGLIPKKEMYGKISIGERVTARVTGVKEDGKLDLSVREKPEIQINVDADAIYSMLQERKGRLGFSDSASPEKIKEETGMSKNQFKRAVGHLLKTGKIEIKPEDIILKK